MLELETSLQDALVKAALEARQNAYAPFSGFLVGAAVLDDRGQITPGVNVENSSYGLTICAERTAICAAVATGAKRIEAIAIAATGAVAPCGACRQFLYEFNPECPVLFIDSETGRCSRIEKLACLLPDGFRLNK